MDGHGDQSTDEARHREGDSGRSGGVDLHSQETHISGDVVGRDKTEINIKRATILQLDRRVFFALLGLVIVVGAALLIIPQLGKTPWATWETIADGKFGIAVAEFAVGGNLVQGPHGVEMSRLIFDKLQSDLQLAKLDKRVVLTKVGLIRSPEEAKSAGDNVHADIVLWGWIPEYAPDSIVPSFTLVGKPGDQNDPTLASMLNVMVSGPGTIQLNQITGQATALSRFVLGLIYLRDKNSLNYPEALKMFTLGAQELNQDLQRLTDLLKTAADANTQSSLQDWQQATRKTLAAFYTLQGIAYAALGQGDNSLNSYKTALTYDDTYPRVYIALGNYNYSLQEFSEAKAAYQKAIDLGADVASAYYGLGVTDFALEDYQASLAALDHAVRLAQDQHDDATLALSYLVEGYAYLKQNNLAEAQQAFAAAANNPSVTDPVKKTALDQIDAIDHPTSTPPSQPTMAATTIITPLVATPLTAQITLLTPAWNASVSNPVLFTWHSLLQAGQKYRVTVSHPASGDVRTSDLLDTENWTVDLPGDHAGEWRWAVAIIDINGGVDTSLGSAFMLSPTNSLQLATATVTPTATLVSTLFPTPLATPSPTPLPTPTSTATMTPTPFPMPFPTPFPTPFPSPVGEPLDTDTPIPVPTPFPTPVATPTSTATITPTVTATP